MISELLDSSNICFKIIKNFSHIHGSSARLTGYIWCDVFIINNSYRELLASEYQ